MAARRRVHAHFISEPRFVLLPAFDGVQFVLHVREHLLATVERDLTDRALRILEVVRRRSTTMI